jgi:hypothetical protein
MVPATPLGSSCRKGVRLDGLTYAVRRDDDFVKSVRQKSGEFIYAGESARLISSGGFS